MVRLSLLLVLLFTYLIIHPVRQIESRILSLGAGVEPDQRRWMARPNWCCWGSDRWLARQAQELERRNTSSRATYPTRLKTPCRAAGGGDLLSGGAAGGGPQRGSAGRSARCWRGEQPPSVDLTERAAADFTASASGRCSPVRGALAPFVWTCPEEAGLRWNPNKSVYTCCPSHQPPGLQSPPPTHPLDNLFSNVVSYGARVTDHWIAPGRAGGGWLEVAKGPVIPPDERERILSL